MAVELNPPGARAELLAGLNRSFPGWGGSREYRWFFGRPVGGPAADILAYRGPEGILAANAVNYRRLDLGTGITVLVGIFTSGWTAPEARRRGHFHRLIEASFAQIRSRGGRLALGFVTAENPSCEAMASAGCELHPSWYLFSTASTTRPQSTSACLEIEASPEVVARLAAESARRRLGTLHFSYDTNEEWASQFLHRPHPVSILSLADGGTALVERTPAADRVQLLVGGSEPEDGLASLLNRAMDAGRQLFMFTADERLAAVARRIGLTTRDGRITVRSLDDDRRVRGTWSLDSGDRM